MKSHFTIAAIFVLGCVTGGIAGRVAVPPAHAAAGVPRWEYNCGMNASVAQLNEAGAEGWELVTAAAVMQNSVPSVGYCFKRSLP
jgi:hypothetical protein